MSSDPENPHEFASSARLRDLDAFARKAPWHERIWRFWFKRRDQFDELVGSALQALRQEAEDERRGRAEAEAKFAAEVIATSLAVEAANEESATVRMMIGALHSVLRATQETVDEHRILNAAHREEDHARIIRLGRLADQQRSNLEAVERVTKRLDDRTIAAMERIEALSTQAGAQAAQSQAEITGLKTSIDGRLKEQQDTLQRVAAEATEHNQELGRQITEELSGVKQSLAQGLEHLQVELGRVDERNHFRTTQLGEKAAADLAAARGAIDWLAESLRTAETALNEGLTRRQEEIRQAEATLKTENAELARRLADVNNGVTFFEDASAAARFEGFYLAFENRYRGSREIILERLRVYLPYIAAAASALKLPPGQLRIIDLGCGRGEWIELLQREGYTGSVGIDQNERMIEDSRAQGLPVESGDAVQYLRSQADGSAAVISAFHVVEHVPFPMLLQLIEEAFRVLAPGGSLIFETPNAENLLTATQNFRTDPTHKFILPPLLLSFAVENGGFRDLVPLRIHPYGPEFQLDASTPIGKRFNEFFFSAQDFGLVGRKP